MDETCLPRACGKLDSGRHSQCDQAWHAYGESNAPWTGYTVRTPFPAWLCEVALRGAADPAEADRVALARQQRRDFVERQTHDVAVGADNLDNEAAGDALRRVSPCFATPLAGGEISFNVILRQALDPYACFHEPLAIGLVRRYQADAGVDAMVASRKQTQALRGLIEQLGLRADSPGHRPP